jgi:LPXTG-site transpeptidase (sortase) family protein
METVMDTPNTQTLSHKKQPTAVFLATVFVVFVLTLVAADSVGFVPYYIDGSTPLTTGGTDGVSLADLPQLGSLEAIEAANPQVIQEGILPERIKAPSIDMDLIVQNPSTKGLEQLDAALQKGPVRYVDSAKLGEAGNMLVFAHSSHLPIVHNQMYRAFNRINELQAGDTITVSGEGRDYIYSVTEVRLTDASEEIIDLSKTSGTHLTLSTCDTFGKKTARWVVEAEFIGVVSS